MISLKGTFCRLIFTRRNHVAMVSQEADSEGNLAAEFLLIARR